MNSAKTAALSNGDPAEYYILGRRHKANNDLNAAEQAYREALRLRPEYVDAWISLGILLRTLGRLDEAEACQRQALDVEPQSFPAQLNLGNILRDRGQMKAAEDCFRAALERNPASAEAHNNLARVLMHYGEFLQAVPHFLRAKQLNAEYFEAAEGLGTALFYSGHYEDAIPALQDACLLRPSDIYVCLLLGNTHLAAGNVEQALAEYERLLRVYPGLPKAKAGIAAALAARGQYTKPRVLFEEAIAREPDEPWIRGHYAHFLLRGGEFAKAWEYYEYRWEAEQSKRVLGRNLSRPKWQGEPLAGKTLLIIAEQGLGDEIMFASIFAEMIREAAHCIIECDERLEKLFRRTFPQATFFPVARNTKGWQSRLGDHLASLPPFDYWTAIANLPRYRRTDPSQFPNHMGYLAASSERTGFWRSRLDALGGGLKIGLSWRGGTKFTNTTKRTLTPLELRPLLISKGTHFVNLQYGDCKSELAAFREAGIDVHHWQEAIDDYDETAALVNALDLVITVCTAVVHLTGALGKPVWVMAPHVPEWRYGREGPSMIWYPSARVFRQPKLGAWTPVIAEVRRSLAKLHRQESIVQGMCDAAR